MKAQFVYCMLLRLHGEVETAQPNLAGRNLPSGWPPLRGGPQEVQERFAIPEDVSGVALYSFRNLTTARSIKAIRQGGVEGRREKSQAMHKNKMCFESSGCF